MMFYIPSRICYKHNMILHLHAHHVPTGTSETVSDQKNTKKGQCSCLCWPFPLTMLHFQGHMRHFSRVACPSSFPSYTILWMAPCHCKWCSLHPASSYLAYKACNWVLTSCTSLWLSSNLKLVQKLFSTNELEEYFQFLSDNVIRCLHVQHVL